MYWCMYWYVVNDLWPTYKQDLYQYQVNSVFHLFGVGKLSTSSLAGIKAERVHLHRLTGSKH